MPADYEKTSFAATHRRERVEWAKKMKVEVEAHITYATNSDTLIDLKLMQSLADSIIEREGQKN